MAATPADIAKYTIDGIVVLYRDDVLKVAQPDAIDEGEIPTFFRYEADALALLTERAAIRAGVGNFHEAIEVDEVLGIGSTIQVSPITPSFEVVDDARTLDVIARTVSVSFDMTIDRYSVELAG